MKILINTSTLVKGGALQVAVSFISELLISPDSNEYVLLCSPGVEKQLKKQFGEVPFKNYLIEISPAKLKTRKRLSGMLDNILTTEKPNIVFTVFGPSYWKPKAVHICGFADGWCYNPDSIAFDKLTWLQKIKTKLLIRYKLCHLKNSSDYIVIETMDAKRKLADALNFDPEKIAVVGNSYNRLVYEDQTQWSYSIDERIAKDKVRILTISAYYPHKNLEIINRVVKIMPEDAGIQFIVTIDHDSFAAKFDKSDSIINLGPVNINQCPPLYELSDIVLMPSLLETFSANFPEAMYMRKPLLTTDLSFAHEICEQAALYYSPDDENDLFAKLAGLIERPDLRTQLVNEGLKQLEKFTQSDMRAKKYAEIFNLINSTGRLVN